jgi:hypothetical protein
LVDLRDGSHFHRVLYCNEVHRVQIEGTARVLVKVRARHFFSFFHNILLSCLRRRDFTRLYGEFIYEMIFSLAKSNLSLMCEGVDKLKSCLWTRLPRILHTALASLLFRSRFFLQIIPTYLIPRSGARSCLDRGARTRSTRASRSPKSRKAVSSFRDALSSSISLNIHILDLC